MATSRSGLPDHRLILSRSDETKTDSADNKRVRNLEDLTWLPLRVGTCLVSLLEAHRYSEDLCIDDWEFATELRTLRSHGLTDTDVRWLVHAGLVDFAYDVSLPGETRRQFRRTENLIVFETVCLVLTAPGVELAEAWVCAASAPRPERVPEWPSQTPAVSVAPTNDQFPTWDRDRQELTVGAVLVKRFKAPAANQETILAAFQEENWPPRIDDPLSPSAEVEPKRRLHDTINSLNRNQKHQVLRFFGDGSGTGIRWEFVNDDTFSSATVVSGT